MPEWLFANEPAIRLGAFAGLLILLAILEAALPRRSRNQSLFPRWFANFSLAGLSVLSVRLFFLAASVSAVGFAAIVGIQGWSPLATFGLPFWAQVVIAFLFLDLVIYLQHVAFHHVPALWRVHRVHHADMDFDVTTGIRFHPIEIVLSMGLKFAAIALIGAPPLAVLLFEVMLNATSLFNHANLKLPLGLDRLVRLVMVTPDMHRVHHSIHQDETDSNFGFNLPWWDRMFGTYRAQPRDGHEDMVIGLQEFREPSEQSLRALLAGPFKQVSS